MRTLLIVAILIVGFANSADARRSATGNGHVAHSRLAPVVMHRAIPGGGGVHVYGGR